jgi:hypothetical protein
MFGFTLYEKRDIVPLSDAIREEMLWLETSDEKFIDALSGSGTDRKDKIQLKFETWINSLREVIGYSSGERRNFSSDFKERLWRANPVCAIDGSKILDPDDAEVDHIEFYWRGGRTIPENARLVHRYCNRKRGGGSEVKHLRTPSRIMQNEEPEKLPGVSEENESALMVEKEVNPASIQIFEALRRVILDMGPDVTERPGIHWHGFLRGKRPFVYIQTRKLKPEIRCRVFGFVPPLRNPKNMKIDIWRNSNGVDELVMYLNEEDVEDAKEIIFNCYSNLINEDNSKKH